jgi:hypothetical protein
VIALGDVPVTEKEITMTPTRYAFVKLNGHADRVSDSLGTLLGSAEVDAVDGDKHKLVAMASTGRQYVKPTRTD